LPAPPSPTNEQTAAPSPADSPTTAASLPAYSPLRPLAEPELYPSIRPSLPLPGEGSPPPGETPAGTEDGSTPEVDEGEATTPGNGRASRIVIPSLGIDLPVVSGVLRVRGNRNNYPLCDVAQYLTAFGPPGHVGATYIYAHAQRGMFLPMLRASRRNGGAEMIGARVEVYTNDLKLHIYQIFRVKRHSTTLNIAYNLAPGEHRLVLQTSEGTAGHRPKLQVAARPVRVVEATAAQALPRTKPRVCLPR